MVIPRHGLGKSAVFGVCRFGDAGFRVLGFAVGIVRAAASSFAAKLVGR